MNQHTFTLDVPPEWERINFGDLQGTLMVLGQPDSGKSTFSSYAYQRLQSLSKPVAYLDGDPGQARLGPPTTMTMISDRPLKDFSLEGGTAHLASVGSCSPSGHMLPLLVGAARLAQKAYDMGAQTLVYDTTGLIDPAGGGVNLKLAKINLLRPTTLFALQYHGELEYLLQPLRRSKRVRIIDLHPSPAVKIRTREQRRAHRAARLAHYFRKARPVRVDWSVLAVFPAPLFSLNRLLALEDTEGFTLGLGIVKKMDHKATSMVLLTPVQSTDGVNALSLGDVAVDPDTFTDGPIFSK